MIIGVLAGPATCASDCDRAAAIFRDMAARNGKEWEAELLREATAWEARAARYREAYRRDFRVD